MANQDDAVNILKLIARHAELLVSSHLNSNGEITLSPENESLIRSLQSARLVWQLDDLDSVQISSVLTKLIDHSLVNYRRHVAHESISDMWNHIIELINEQYFPAKLRCATSDFERASAEIQETCIDLIEMIHTSTIRFSEYISSKFAFVSNLDLRIKKNEQVINQAQRLNDLLNTFSISELIQVAGADDFLRRLLLKTFSKEIEKSRKNLLNSLHQLIDLLHSLRESADINRLIEAFERKYEKDRGFEPSIHSITRYPAFLRLTESCIEANHADVNDILHEECFSKLCLNIREFDTETEEKHDVINVDDRTEKEDTIVEQDPVHTMAEALILAAQQSDVYISAFDVYDKTGIHHYDIWLYTVMNIIEALPSDARNSIAVCIIERPDNAYPHNYEILDIKVKSNATINS